MAQYSRHGYMPQSHMFAGTVCINKFGHAALKWHQPVPPFLLTPPSTVKWLVVQYQAKSSQVILFSSPENRSVQNAPAVTCTIIMSVTLPCQTGGIIRHGILAAWEPGRHKVGYEYIYLVR